MAEARVSGVTFRQALLGYFGLFGDLFADLLQ